MAERAEQEIAHCLPPTNTTCSAQGLPFRANETPRRGSAQPEIQHVRESCNQSIPKPEAGILSNTLRANRRDGEDYSTKRRLRRTNLQGSAGGGAASRARWQRREEEKEEARELAMAAAGGGGSRGLLLPLASPLPTSDQLHQRMAHVQEAFSWAFSSQTSPQLAIHIGPNCETSGPKIRQRPGF